jgi:hypothetical protein
LNNASELIEDTSVEDWKRKVEGGEEEEDEKRSIFLDGKSASGKPLADGNT